MTSGNQLTVVVSQGRSRNPAKRRREEELTAALAAEPVEVIVVPHLHDLSADGPAMTRLRGVEGDLVVFAWLHTRAVHWILDRNGIRGRAVETLPGLEEAQHDAPPGEPGDQETVAQRRETPDRRIVCADLRRHVSAEPYVEAFRRFLAETVVAPSPPSQGPVQIEEETARRWYPVIDFSRCTNCMECVDFCLFGVYGLDISETILVEQPDNCRMGCPACARVCPAGAILFPQHKDPAIAGSEATRPGGMKIDLSGLFGGDGDVSPMDTATQERAEHLRQAEKTPSPQDDLDELMDELDKMDL